MKKTSTLSEGLKSRLKAYSMTAGAVAAGAVGAQAQIDYTDIDPDVTSDTVYLDMDGDGTNDLMFMANSFTLSTGAITVYRGFVQALDTASIAASASGSYFYPYALQAGDTIKNSLNFTTGSSNFQTLAWNTFYSSTSAYNLYGNFISGGDEGYIGVKLNSNGESRFGWVRLEVEFGEITVKDFALESTDATQLIAGDTTRPAPPAGIAEINANVGLNSNNKILTITTDQVIEDLTITTISGQLVSNHSNIQTSKMIDMNAQSSGIYLATYKVNGAMKSEKFLLD